MRIVLQRVKRAKVTVDGEITGAIGQGLLLFVGFAVGDGEKEIQYLAEKVVHLRVFEDEAGKMNRSLLDVGGAILSVSQFTLYGDLRKGRRPNFMRAEKPERAQQLYLRWNEVLSQYGIRVETGRFGAMMEVELINDGPVTLFLDSADFSVL